MHARALHMLRVLRFWVAQSLAPGGCARAAGRPAAACRLSLLPPHRRRTDLPCRMLRRAAQIAACPEVIVVGTDEVPVELLERERAIEMEKEDIKSKPEAIRGKIVQGRVDKIAKTMALLEQPFVKVRRAALRWAALRWQPAGRGVDAAGGGAGGGARGCAGKQLVPTA